ncbi:transposable element Tcb2 transposase [Trichonephila clavipes]|uniref:Transposable element Tcb2 transposase n=1 Tax=Trichonephila clavipes TaxID=2585209 RepID=A0A8X6W847_TRICX|nr:transposable element Tcb2 transposase [Trichonephila clavipes]
MESYQKTTGGTKSDRSDWVAECEFVGDSYTLATITNSRIGIQEVQPKTVMRYHESTVLRRLRERDIYARQPAICVPLTSRQRRKSLQCKYQHVPWTRDQWRTVIFADELGLCLESNSWRVFIWREPEIRFHPLHIRERDAYGSGSACVWGCISLCGRTYLHVFFRGNVNACTYRNDILDAYVRLYVGVIGDVFVLQDDNARPLRAHIMDAYLEQKTHVEASSNTGP